MSPYRAPAGAPADAPAPALIPGGHSTRCFLNPLGPAVVLELVHHGALFELFRVQVGERIYAVKSPRREPPSGAICWEDTQQCFGTSDYFVGTVKQQSFRPALWPWLSFAFLCAESEHVRSTGDHWNHSVVALGLWDEGDPAHLDVRDSTPVDRPDQRFRPALIMPWYDGDDLGSLPRDEQRALFPRMLPALWDSLLAACHRDLSPSNLRLSPDRHRFILLDPGVHLVGAGTGTWGGHKSDDIQLMITNAHAYPLLHPNTPSTMLEEHDLAALLSYYRQGFGLPSGAVARPGPPPADWLATGVLYFEVLTRQHPFYRPGFDVPGWCGSSVELCWTAAERSVIRDPDFPRWATRCRDTLASVPTLTEAERKLAMSLLCLSFTSREELVAAVVAVRGG